MHLFSGQDARVGSFISLRFSFCVVKSAHVSTSLQVTLSVFEREHSIITAKDLWDSRLGIYNLPGNNNHCQTCGARKASDCDGMRIKYVPPSDS